MKVEMMAADTLVPDVRNNENAVDTDAPGAQGFDVESTGETFDAIAARGVQP